ncbi:hypothetical protein BLJ79_21500 [Arthrobacter sp. UCD-GKA]|nr:hypothetical protein BLJ79_21500 [Arthrobacter sp. UCD-GKA]
MARDRANIRVDMLANTEYRDLSMAAQHLYKLLLIHPTLNYAGVADWRPGRIAKITRGITAHDVRTAAKELQAGAYVYVDEETEEVFIRSFIRHDGLLTRYRLPIAMANAYADISSPEIRRYFVHELSRIHASDPDMKCWEEPRVQSILREPPEDMKAMGNSDGQGVLQGIGYGMGYAINADEVTPGATTTPTPTTTPPTEGGAGGGRRKPERPLPADWAPNDTHKGFARTEGINLTFQAERFTNWATAKDARYRDWDAAFRNWLLKAEKSQTNSPSPWDRKGIH